MTTSKSNSLSKVKTMYLSKEATEKDRQMKNQMVMIIENSDSSASERIGSLMGSLETKEVT